MVMFSDQDDVWLPDKVERAWWHLRPLDGQAGLYGSAQMLVDADLRPSIYAALAPRAVPGQRADRNIITGCTAALNRPRSNCCSVSASPTVCTSMIGGSTWW